MNTLVLFALVLLVGASAKPQGGRVVGGQNARQEEAPWQISLWHHALFSAGHVCGGSIVDKNWVLTAAHCCEGMTADQMSVKYGGLNRNSLQFENKITKVVKHPNWDTDTTSADFCLLKLAAPVQESASVKIAEFCTEYPADNKICKVTGWGKTNGRQSILPVQLQVGDLNCQNRQECKRIWSRGATVDETMVCSQSKTISGCNADSGGPMTVDGKLCGVVSYGVEFCPPGAAPNVYGFIPYAKPWIIQTIANN